MKILTLRFANLNSLEGEWTIDFTRPEYVSDGIFAITGPTGSGKSTILDALCLALYGQTPRLGKVTKGGNDIMSRHAGECFAEATFSTAKGSYKCYWSQHRARRRPGGELQVQKHEISDAVSSQLLHSKLQDTLAAVEEVTGMDFDRFTRSMLLAQGGFAAFLQADPDRRAPVLEQITGTEIYSHISVRVHERQRNERMKLDLLRSEAGTLRLLGEGEEASLRSEVDALLSEETEFAGQLEAASAAIRSREQITRLLDELEAIDRQIGEVDLELDAFAPDAARLRSSRMADSLEKPYAALQHQRQELLRESGELSDRERARPGLEAAVQRDRQRLDLAEKTLREATKSGEMARPLHMQARELDRRISEKHAACDSIRQALEGHEQALETFVREHAELASALELKRQEYDATLDRLMQGCADEGLVSGLSGIRHAFEELEAERRRLDSSESDLSGAEAEEDACMKAKTDAEQAVTDANKAVAEAERILKDRKEELSALLEGKSLKALRTDLDESRERRRLLEEIAGLYATGREFAPKIAQLVSAIDGLEATKSEAEARLAEGGELLVSLEREVELLEENRRLAEKVKSYEEERRRLSEGEPCPLCGSTTHPFAMGAAPRLPDGDVRLAEAKETVRRQARIVKELEHSIIGSTTEITQRKGWLSELESDRDSYGRKCVGLLRQAGVSRPSRDAEPVVLESLEALKRSMEELAARVGKAESLEQLVHDAERSRQSLLDDGAGRDRVLILAVERFSAASSGHLRAKTAHGDALKEFQRRFSELRQLLEPYGLLLEPDHDSVTVVEGLASRRERRLADEANKSALESGITQDLAAISVVDARIASARGEFEAKRLDLDAAATEAVALSDRRKELFGDRDPVAEEERLAAAVAAARVEFDEARDTCSGTLQAFSVLETAMTTLAGSIEKRKGEIDALLSGFSKDLRLKGFEDEQTFAASRLPEAERQRLETESESLRRKREVLTSNRADRSGRLQQEQEGIVDDRTMEELSRWGVELRESLRVTREKIGAIRQQLVENDRLVGEQRRMAVAIEAQASECRRWELLHELIGSADGKKFRNFAQGLTFEVMVAHANRQLASMTDRYLLVRDEEVPLELNVVDNWQAGEVRSTRNLSGGESFIVSLALALGLSQMSSRKVRVDSLFLDEGFGTLDEDALETALETLSGLQQSGKLIGIISHVSALKERISTRIRVTPLTGGRSAISGPGVSRK
jgi:exonuclease SbcC